MMKEGVVFARSYKAVIETLNNELGMLKEA